MTKRHFKCFTICYEESRTCEPKRCCNCSLSNEWGSVFLGMNRYKTVPQDVLESLKDCIEENSPYKR